MNVLDDYDVDDDLPVNSKENVTNIKKNDDNKKRNVRTAKEQLQLDQDESRAMRKPRVKLDFNRLLRGSRGLGYLALTAKRQLKLSSRPGSEAQNLSQICVYLQEWAKLVFPKMNLADFLGKSEEICQSRIMKDCVPKLLEKLKEMGDDANLADLATVESEILTRMATEEAEKALQSIKTGKNGNEEADDFDIEAALADYEIEKKYNNKNNKKMKRFERSETLKDESEQSEDEQSEEFEEEMADFIDDTGEDDKYETEIEVERERERERQVKKRAISFNFGSDTEESETNEIPEMTSEEVAEIAVKRSARVIMSDEEE